MRRVILTGSDEVKMQKLWYAGLNLTTIGERFRVSIARVRKILTKMGVDVPVRRRRGAYSA